MKLYYFVVLGLVLAIMIILILHRKKMKRFLQEMYEQKIMYEHQLSVQEATATEYKNQVLSNLRETIPYGERLLIRCFKKLFDESILSDSIIFNHLEFETEHGFRQVDFFIVSSSGLFVAESKRWKGVTHICSNSYPDMFQKTAYRAFGVGSSERVRVFNAQQSEDSSGQIQLSAYQNPVVQVREYSRHLLKILSVKPIKNIVIFTVADGYEVLYDNEPLTIVDVDNFTSLTTDNSLKRFFETRKTENWTDKQHVAKYIEGNMNYRFKLDKDNYQQAPFKSL